MNENIIEEVLNHPNLLNKLAQKLADEKSRRLEVERKVNLLKGNIIANKPYVDFSKTVSNVEGAISIGSFAKLLNNWFRENGYLIKSGKEKNNPKQKYIDMGFFRVVERVIQTENGDKLIITPLITGKGQLYFMKIVEEDFILN